MPFCVVLCILTVNLTLLTSFICSSLFYAVLFSVALVGNQTLSKFRTEAYSMLVPYWLFLALICQAVNLLFAQSHIPPLFVCMLAQQYGHQTILCAPKNTKMAHPKMAANLAKIEGNVSPRNREMLQTYASKRYFAPNFMGGYFLAMGHLGILLQFFYQLTSIPVVRLELASFDCSNLCTLATSSETLQEIRYAVQHPAFQFVVHSYVTFFFVHS